jgi:thioesterase domain-containing protein/acyl carrier protein
MSDIALIPTTSLEKTIANYWRSVLNTEDIGLDDNFFDIGGTSLLAMRCINQINHELELSLPVSAIYQLSTIRQLAYKIEHTESDELNPVILLKEGEGTPLFIFPPWSSYPTIFNGFVETYKGNNPLYGIIYTEDSDNFPYKDLQEYAHFIIGHIQKIDPYGPYGLLGCSMGARTILEVAIQLKQAGGKIGFLGAVSHYPSYPRNGLILNRRLRDEIRTFLKINLNFKMKYLRYRLFYFLKLLFVGDNTVQEIIIENGAQNQILAIHEVYEPKSKYDGDLVLIYETSPDGARSELKKSQVYRNSIFKLLWKKWVTGEVSVRIVECNHNDFFKKPAVYQVTDIVGSYLS